MPTAPNPHAAPRRLLALSAVLAVGLAALTGCGKKGDPEPPLRLIPKAGSDLSARQQGTEAVLWVAYPSVATNGMALPGLEAVEVWHLARPLPSSGEAQKPERREFKAAAELERRFTGAELESATAGDRLRLRLPLGAALEGDSSLALSVRFVSTRGEVSEDSNLALLVPAAPPPPPSQLGVEARADGVEVTWADGGEGVGGFRVYRRQAAERSYGEPLARLEAGDIGYLDTTARYDTRYIYGVTAVDAAAPNRESALVAEREIDYQDRFPPPAPEGLVALAESGRIRLSWRASQAEDVAGYHVYRRGEGGVEMVRQTLAPGAETSFLDTGLEAGRTFAYQVRAVDQKGNEGPPSATVEATVR